MKFQMNPQRHKKTTAQAMREGFRWCRAVSCRGFEPAHHHPPLGVDWLITTTAPGGLPLRHADLPNVLAMGDPERAGARMRSTITPTSACHLFGAVAISSSGTPRTPRRGARRSGRHRRGGRGAVAAVHLAAVAVAVVFATVVQLVLGELPPGTSPTPGRSRWPRRCGRILRCPL